MIRTGARADDLRLSGPLGLRRHGQAVLQLLAEDDILDQHAFDRGTPAGGRLFDDLADGLGDLLAALDDILQHAGADDVAQGGLGALDEGLAQVGDAEGGLVRAGDVVVDDGGEGQVDVVLGHADLLGHLDDLDLDVDLDQALGERVDFDEAWVHGAPEAAELRDQAHLALRDGLVGVRADDAAWDRAHGSDAAAEGVDHAWWWC